MYGYCYWILCQQSHKTKALLAIFGIISTATEYANKSQQNTAAETYVIMLDQHDTSIVWANARGEHTQGPVTPERMDNENDEVEEVGDKRHRASTPDLPRKQVCDDSVFPWIVKQKITGSKLSNTLALTWKMVLNYSADIKLTKWSLLNDEDVPEFPDSEWTSVLSGKAINLDAVFSGALSTVTDNKTVETFRRCLVALVSKSPDFKTF